MFHLVFTILYIFLVQEGEIDPSCIIEITEIVIAIEIDQYFFSMILLIFEEYKKGLPILLGFSLQNSSIINKGTIVPSGVHHS